MGELIATVLLASAIIIGGFAAWAAGFIILNEMEDNDETSDK